MIVVDTNIIVYLYINGERSLQAEELLSKDPEWTAPDLWLSEFKNVLSLYLRKNLLTLDEIWSILQQAEALLAHNEYRVASAEVMQLVNSSNCSAYDCEFVALAQHLGVKLVTVDKKIIKDFPNTAIALEEFLQKY
ncbi:MAG: type II toxin-antitoxin system VapC family toxin [Waterburya sp.]